jgi:hypothetical protein
MLRVLLVPVEVPWEFLACLIKGKLLHMVVELTSGLIKLVHLETWNISWISQLAPTVDWFPLLDEISDAPMMNWRIH